VFVHDVVNCIRMVSTIVILQNTALTTYLQTCAVCSGLVVEYWIGAQSSMRQLLVQQKVFPCTMITFNIKLIQVPSGDCDWA